MNFLAIILIFVLVMFVYLKVNFKNFNVQNKLIKVICKVAISKDNYILIVQIMEKYYLCSSSNNSFNVIENLDEEKVISYMSSKKSTLLEKE